MNELEAVFQTSSEPNQAHGHPKEPFEMFYRLHVFSLPRNTPTQSASALEGFLRVQRKFFSAPGQWPPTVLSIENTPGQAALTVRDSPPRNRSLPRSGFALPPLGSCGNRGRSASQGCGPTCPGHFLRKIFYLHEKISPAFKARIAEDLLKSAEQVDRIGAFP